MVAYLCARARPGVQIRVFLPLCVRSFLCVCLCLRVCGLLSLPLLPLSCVRYCAVCWWPSSLLTPFASRLLACLLALSIQAYELSTLTGAQVLLLVASETGHVYTFATDKLQPIITQENGKQMIQRCLDATNNDYADDQDEAEYSGGEEDDGGAWQ